jgi:hypothetical protein
VQKYNLYVTDWAPNGTNDLLVVDAESGGILEMIESATFGINVAKGWYGHVIDADQNEVIELSEAQQRRFRQAAVNGEPHDWFASTVRPISVDELFRKLAVSPVDPDGDDVIDQLARLGIVKESV